VSQNFGILFFQIKDYVLMLTKTSWASSWAIYFTNSSGRPGCFIPNGLEADFFFFSEIGLFQIQ
jgi:hypothetical protein